METAAKLVISDDNISEHCKTLMKDFPFSAIQMAIDTKAEHGLMTMITNGEAHVVDKLVQAKILSDSIDEQPNSVVSGESQVVFLKQEVVKLTEFFEKHLAPTVDLLVKVIHGADSRSVLLESGVAPDQFRCLAKLLRAWKARQCWNSPVILI